MKNLQCFPVSFSIRLLDLVVFPKTFFTCTDEFSVTWPEAFGVIAKSLVRSEHASRRSGAAGRSPPTRSSYPSR